MKPYDPDDDLGHDSYAERLLDRADYLRDEMKDREAEETFPASSDAAETPPAATSPAEPSHTFAGERDGEAAGGELGFCQCGEALVQTKIGNIVCAESARIYRAAYREDCV